MIPYAEVDRELKPLLMEFGPERKAYHTEYPFQRLENDGIRELHDASNLTRRASRTTCSLAIRSIANQKPRLSTRPHTR